MMHSSKVIERPFSANYMGDNDFFAYRRVAGNNPFALKRIKKIPDNFPVSNNLLSCLRTKPSNLSVKQLIKRNDYLKQQPAMGGLESPTPAL